MAGFHDLSMGKYWCRLTSFGQLLLVCVTEIYNRGSTDPAGQTQMHQETGKSNDSTILVQMAPNKRNRPLRIMYIIKKQENSRQIHSWKFLSMPLISCNLLHLLHLKSKIFSQFCLKGNNMILKDNLLYKNHVPQKVPRHGMICIAPESTNQERNMENINYFC